MNKTMKYIGKGLVLTVMAVVLSCIVFLSLPSDGVAEAKAVSAPILSGTHDWWANQKNNGVYAGSWGVASVPGAALSSTGNLNYYNGKYYMNSSDLTASFSGVSNNWNGFGDGESTGANYAKITIGGEAKEAGDFCAQTSGNYVYAENASAINNLYLVTYLSAGETTVTFLLQQGSKKTFWKRQDSVQASVVVVYDNSAPSISINGLASGYATSTSITISASDNYGVATIKLDGQGISQNHSVARASLSDGTHTVEVWDLAGNCSTASFVVDNTVPVLSGASNNAYLNQAFTITAKDTNFSNLYFKAPNASSWSAVGSSSKNVATNAGDGLWQFYAVDAVGQQSAVLGVTLDTVAPNISGKTNGAYTNQPFTITASDINLDKLYVKTPSTAFSATSGNTYSVAAGSTNGAYEFYAVDRAGNRYPSSGTYVVYYDTVAPTLSGISDGAFYAADFAATFSSSLKLNSGDIISAFYSRSDTGNYPTTATSAYTSGTTVSTEGNYLFRIADAAGNATTYRVVLDKTAPQLTLNGINDFGFTNGTVTPSWATTVGGAGTARMNIDDTLTVRYAVSSSGVYPNTAANTYSSEFTEEGNYLITITDRAGNTTRYNFTIDKVAPTLLLRGLVDGLSYHASINGFYAYWQTTAGGIGAPYANDDDFMTVSFGLNNATDFPTLAPNAYVRNTTLSEEGYYLLRIADAAGNFTDYHVIVDCTAPTVSNISEYLNTSFDYTATDLHGTTIKYTFNGGDVMTTSQGVVSVACVLKNYGTWTFYAVDDIGNKTDMQIVNLYYRDDFGNLDGIKNGYKVTSWYTVTLTSKIFTDIAGNYTFATQASAMSFAIAKEWQYRVESLSGNRWSYVNITNESVTQIYDNRAELDAAVSKYAAKYISARKTLQLGANLYPNPTDDNGVTRNDALTAQSITCPEFLVEYASLPIYIMQHDFTFVEPLAGVAGNTRNTTIKYVANDFALVVSTKIELSYGAKISVQLSAAGAYKQGYYLVEETDRCGNVQRYVVYLDTDTPTLNGTVMRGDGSQQDIAFNNGYVTENANVMLYVSMQLKSFIDNIDEFAVICVSGREMADVCFVAGDELPTLSFENGYYGKYVINVYDRSMNYISFTVRIAGEVGSVGYTSLANETKCTLTIKYDSANNGITDVHLFKVSYTGEYAELYFDSDGTAISAATLAYVLRVGGKYVVRFTDIFGRTVETEPIFYMKGLPSGVLKGVKEGGVTKNDVSFEYYDGNGIWLYALVGREWQRCDDVMQVVAKEGYSVATITASEQTSKIFKFFLYVAEDLNLFVEYRFEIDCIAPQVSITTLSGSNVVQNDVTRSSFSVSWDEANVTARYYSKNDPLGSFSETTYVRRSLVTKAGEYVFTISDKVGNVTSFTVTLDNVVSYTLGGNYSVLEDGSIISKTSIILTVTERTSRFSCVATNGLTVQNGETLTIDGTYTFSVADAYGNELTLTAIIDKLPPMPVIMTTSSKPLTQNGATNENFTVYCEEANVSITIKNGTQYVLYDGAALTAEGEYSFRLTDRMGNLSAFTVTIDRMVNYTVKGTYKELGGNQLISRYNFILVMNEAYSSFTVTSTNGLTFLPDEKVSNEGVYDVTITDVVGNVVHIQLIIDQTAPSPIVTAEDGSAVTQGKTKMPFVVSNPESNGTIKVSRSSTTAGSIYLGEKLTQTGIYYFVISDFVGNERSFTVEIDTVLSYVIGGVYKTLSDGTFVSKSGLSVTVKEDYSVFEVANIDHVSFAQGEMITQEGNYTVTITDIAGNTSVLILVIDKTAPTYLINTASGKSAVANGIINESFKVVCSEAQSSITISTNGTRYASYDGMDCTADGLYYFVVSDYVGNEVAFTVEIDLGIAYVVKGTYKLAGNVYSSKTALTVELSEAYTRFEVVSSNGVSFAPGEAIDREGSYLITIADLAGNIAQLQVIIDKTAPMPIIINQSGGTIAQNGATRLPFSVQSEDDATITYSSNGTRYALYDGSVLTNEAKHYFIVSDYVGNEISFTVMLDASVEYSIKGTYSDGGARVYVSRYGLSVAVDELYSSFDVISNNNTTFATGERVSKEGIYDVTITDVVGNVVYIQLIIDQTAPIISADVENGGITRNAVAVHIDGASRVTYRNGAADAVVVGASFTLSDSGAYQIFATDLAGNEATYKFNIDGGVEVVVLPSIVNGQVISSSIAFKFNEDVTTSLIKNGSEIGYLSTISEAGSYTLTATDKQGNVYMISWTIVYAAAMTYGFSVPEGYSVIATKDGQPFDVTGSNIDLSQDGNYSFVFSNSEGEFSLALVVDTAAPECEITQEKHQVIFSKANKENVTYELYLNGKLVDCRPNSALTERGDYKLVVTDELGNVNEYTFSLNYINTYGIVVISIGLAVLLFAAIGILAYRGKQKIK